MDGYQRDPRYREDLPQSGEQPAGGEPASTPPAGDVPPPRQEVPVYDHLDRGYGAQGPRRGSGLRTCLLTCLVVGVLALLMAVLGCSLAWGPFKRMVVDSDMDSYRDAVRGSELDEGRKRLLVHKIEHLRGVLAERPIGFGDWVDHTESLDSLVEDGELTTEEADLLEQELSRIAKALETDFPPLPEGEEPLPPEGSGAVPMPEPF